VHAILYLLALVVGTVWYGSTVIIAALLRRPHHSASVYERAAHNWAGLLLKAAGVTVSVEGTERLSQTQAQIIISNHQSWFDILAVFYVLPVEVRFVAKKELFAIPFFGSVLHALGHVRLDRTNLKQAITAYEKASAYIREQRLSVLVFAEGTRSRTGLLQPFKTGPFVLAIESGAPVVPVYVAGTFGILPKGSIRVRPSEVHVTVAAPLATTGLTVEDRGALRDRAREAIARMRAASVDAPRDAA
jgi:1-acyl-sn-glycerol-3-phosphate acyltransferase